MAPRVLARSLMSSERIQREQLEDRLLGGLQDRVLREDLVTLSRDFERKFDSGTAPSTLGSSRSGKRSSESRRS
jgi:hypothetical protein